jgi:hypothetical protein
MPPCSVIVRTPWLGVTVSVLLSQPVPERMQRQIEIAGDMDRSARWTRPGI